MKKAVVTGANGFAGSALCRELSARGAEVVAVVRSKEADCKRIGNIPNLRVAFCDLSDFGQLADVIGDKDADVMYHLAWRGSAGELRADSGVQLSNVRHTLDAVKACGEMGCPRFVFASSIFEYELAALMGTARPADIGSLYSAAKLSANYMAGIIAPDLGVRYVRALISNIYGPGERSPRLINASLRKLLSGEHCAFTPGEQLYDFIYITDAAKALAEIGEKGKANRTYYIGSQNPRPLKEFLLKMGEQAAAHRCLGLGELPFGGVSLSYKEFDVMAVKNDTGFTPQVSFDEGIRRTIAWIKEGN